MGYTTGFVVFSSINEAQQALSMEVHSVNGGYLKVVPAKGIPKMERYFT